MVLQYTFVYSGESLEDCTHLRNSYKTRNAEIVPGLYPELHLVNYATIDGKAVWSGMLRLNSTDEVEHEVSFEPLRN